MGSASPLPAPRGLAEIGQIAISVTDVNRAAAFYRDALGMKFLFEFPGLAFFDCAGVRLMLSGAEQRAQTDNYILYFKVPEIQESYRALLSRGVAFESEPRLIARMPDHDLWIAAFRDPDRNLLALMCEVSR